jgi:tRNA (adenine57-N1/adenine58-N1)-methyltransferase
VALDFLVADSSWDLPLYLQSTSVSRATVAPPNNDRFRRNYKGHQEAMTDLFCDGEKALFVDSKKRRYLVTLNPEGEFHSHAGYVPHTLVLEREPGLIVESTKGAKYIVLRPTLEDFVVEMPRGAQVIYPKDLAPMCMLGDIHPGVRVLETGIGSGALSMTMLRWGAHITGVEVREDFLRRATNNVRSFLGEEALSRYNVGIGDSYEAIPEGPYDRVMLDLPEPWQVIPHTMSQMVRGGILVAYTPSITQAVQVREALGKEWVDQRTLEVLHRTWHIEGMAVRPDHRMVAHTAFLTVARFIGDT